MARTFAVLEDANLDDSTQILTLCGMVKDSFAPEISMRREGAYVVISAGTGVIEVALRLRHEELINAFTHLQPNDGLTTTRQVGTGESYLGIGLKTDQSLVLRPVIVGDATGHLRLNFSLTPNVREALVNWLQAK